MMVDTEYGIGYGIGGGGGERNGISKIRDLIRRQRQESDGGGGMDDGLGIIGDLEFTYADTDTYTNEISELYSYTEVGEFRKNLISFEYLMQTWGFPLQWQRLNAKTKSSTIQRILNQLDLSNKTQRNEAARALLYVAQGCWAEVQSEQEQQQWTRQNVALLLRNGAFGAVIDVLSLEIEFGPTAIRKPAVSLADSSDLRVILSILYTIVETMRTASEDETGELQELRSMFHTQISEPVDDELLAIKLFKMVTKFCGGSAPHFPIKKVLLLLWKMILLSLGDSTELRNLKNKYRAMVGLQPLKDDTIEVSKNMRASSPPASASDRLEEIRNIRPIRRSLVKQGSLDEAATLDLEMNDQLDEEMKEIEERRAMEESGELPQPPSPRPMTPLPSKTKGLPWTPKVRPKDLDAFLDTSRIKFVGFPIQNDRETLAGLPPPIHEGVKVLKSHVYVSLNEWQITREEDLWKSPMSLHENEYELASRESETECLYAAVLPNLPQYVIALLKILLAAAPTSKSKTESINIMADVLPEEMPMTVVQSMKLGVDVARHKEIIVKAISGILLLLLKHTKLNHIYQFEFISQHLVFANCIPLVLKFFNQNITAYITAKNTIVLTDFPSCVLGDPPELTPESLELGEPQPYCWRNLFACINLLRILNKLTKWKHSRIMMLVVFKSAPILKRSLRVKHPVLQLYILKLLKMQTKYLGRQWRKANMKTMSAIYQKVRHRLTDDWAYGNDLDARPWDFQAEECSLRAAVDRFNNRRYGETGKNLPPDFESVDNCISSVLGRPIQLTSAFKENYEQWLEQEVFKNPINWDEVINSNEFDLDMFDVPPLPIALLPPAPVLKQSASVTSLMKLEKRVAELAITPPNVIRQPWQSPPRKIPRLDFTPINPLNPFVLRLPDIELPPSPTPVTRTRANVPESPKTPLRIIISPGTDLEMLLPPNLLSRPLHPRVAYLRGLAPPAKMSRLDQLEVNISYAEPPPPPPLPLRAHITIPETDLDMVLPPNLLSRPLHPRVAYLRGLAPPAKMSRLDHLRVNISYPEPPPSPHPPLRTPLTIPDADLEMLSPRNLLSRPLHPRVAYLRGLAPPSKMSRLDQLEVNISYPKPPPPSPLSLRTHLTIHDTDLEMLTDTEFEMLSDADLLMLASTDVEMPSPPRPLSRIHHPRVSYLRGLSPPAKMSRLDFDISSPDPPPDPPLPLRTHFADGGLGFHGRIR